MIPAIVSLGGLGLLFGGVLAFASKKFAVYVDPQIEAIRDALPGANCGACGFAGCANFSDAVAAGEAGLADCTPGGADVAAKVADILGMPKPEEGVKVIAQVNCIGFGDIASDSFVYDGILDCTAANAFFDGFKECKYGCLGLGTCAVICPFDAITMKDGKPIIDPELCKACKKCVDDCPRGVISMVHYNPEAYAVLCNSQDKGKQTKAVCQVGCIGDGRCVKVCEYDAMTFEKGKLTKIFPEKCTACGKCAEKCPRNCIVVPSQI